MQRLILLSLAISMPLAAGLTLNAGQQPVKKQPIPDKKSLDKANELVNDIFKEEIAKATDAVTRTKLAAYLVTQGDESGDDPAARYVLYRQALGLAVQAGDAPLSLSTIDKLATHFEVVSLDLKAETLAKLVEHVPTKEPSKALTEQALALVAEALDADNYDAAIAFGKAATEAAKKSQVIALVNSVAKRNAEVEAAKEKFSVLQPFVDRLKKDANDAEANLKLGEYFGLFKGKWDRALPHLAKSKSDPLASLAQRDLADPKETPEQAALADAWWDYAIKQPEPQQGRLQERAAFWYDRALTGLAGLSRTKAQKRIDLVAARGQAVKPAVDVQAGFIKSLPGHSNEVRGVAISGDGRFGLSCSVDKSVRLWDLNTGKQAQEFKGHNKEVWGVAFVPGGKYVMSASWDGTVKMWDLASGNVVRTFSHPLDVNAVTVSKDGKWMLTGCDDKNMRLWDLTKNEEAKKFTGHTNFCYAVAFSPNGQLVASGSVDRKALVFDLANGKVIREVEQNNAIGALTFSPDSKYLFTTGDNAVHMWDIASGKEEKKFDSPEGYINSMALTPDGKRLVTGGEDKLVRVWDVATGKEIARYPGHTMTISAVAVSSDGRRALTGQKDGVIRYWGLPGR